MNKLQTKVSHLSSYLGASVYENDNHILIARDDEFSIIELEFIEKHLDSVELKYELIKNQIKITNENCHE